jgi:7,8-dihydroneopterin aldolase/epimerase/oxygenase
LSDRIVLHRIAVFAHHGVYAEEERLGQRFYVSLECVLDLSGASRHDDLKRTVSYAMLADIVTRVATQSRYKLIEALAEAIALEVLAAAPNVQEVAVTVEKPGAPVRAIIDGVSVEVRRRRT